MKAVKRLSDEEEDVAKECSDGGDEEALPPVLIVLIGGDVNHESDSNGRARDGAEQEPVEVAGQRLGFFGILGVKLVGAEGREGALDAADAEGEEAERGVEVDGGATLDATGLGARLGQQTVTVGLNCHHR